MTDTDIAGDNRKVPMPKRGRIKYRATLDGKESPLFNTRQKARDWIAKKRETTGDYDSDSTLDEVEG